MSEGKHSRISPTQNLDGLRATTTDQTLQTIADQTTTMVVEGITVETTTNTAKDRVRTRVRITSTTIGGATQGREGSRDAVFNRINRKGRDTIVVITVEVDREVIKMIATKIAMIGVVIGSLTTEIDSTVLTV